MTSDLEDLVRATLADHAPSTVRPADWAALRARAARRTATGRTTAVVGAAAVTALAVTTPWASAPAGVSPAAPPAPPVASATLAASAQPVVRLSQDVVNTALGSQRALVSEWSTGPATRETIERALGALMGSAHITDPSAQPQVIWSSAGHEMDNAQGPQVLVAVEQSGEWVLGFWDERAPFGGWIRAMAFGTMPGGPLDDRLVGFSIADGEETNSEYINIGGALVVYVPPVAASRVVSVVTQGQIDAGATDPLGTETDLDPGFGAYIVSTPWTVRAYAADATILDEQTFE